MSAAPSSSPSHCSGARQRSVVAALMFCLAVAALSWALVHFKSQASLTPVSHKAEVRFQEQTFRQNPPAHAKPAGQCAQEAVFRAENSEGRLLQFLNTGDLSALGPTSPKQIRNLLLEVINVIGPSDVIRRTTGITGLSDVYLPREPDALAEFLTDWIGAVALKDPLGGMTDATRVAPVAAVAFSNAVNASGYVLSSQAFLPGSSQTVYAVFETPADVPTQALAVWRNLSAGTVAFQKIVSLDPRSATTSLWFTRSGGFSPGRWTLDVFDPRFAFRRPIATGDFQIDSDNNTL